MKFFKKLMGILVVFLLVWVAVVCIQLYLYTDGGFKGLISEIGSEKNSLSFLLIGVDQANHKSEERQRSDVMMLVNINSKTGEISFISVPRDSKTLIYEKNGYERLNHAYRYGGIDLSLKTLNKLLGTDIKSYMVVDYSLVKKVVNLIGGVRINVPVDMDYEDPTANPPLKIHLKAGEQTLNGDKAIQFLRFRNTYKMGDLDRVVQQQAFMKQFAKKCLSPFNLLKLPIMLKYYRDYVDTNIPVERLIALAKGYNKYKGDRIFTATLPGTPVTVNGMKLYELDKGKVETILREHLK